MSMFIKLTFDLLAESTILIDVVVDEFLALVDILLDCQVPVLLGQIWGVHRLCSWHNGLFYSVVLSLKRTVHLDLSLYLAHRPDGTIWTIAAYIVFVSFAYFWFLASLLLSVWNLLNQLDPWSIFLKRYFLSASLFACLRVLIDLIGLLACILLIVKSKPCMCTLNPCSFLCCRFFVVLISRWRVLDNTALLVHFIVFHDHSALLG